MKLQPFTTSWRHWGLLLLAAPALLHAQAQRGEGPPGRAVGAGEDEAVVALHAPVPLGRIAAVQGQVYAWEPALRAWAPAEPSRPIAEGDRVSTGPVGRSELQLGSSTLRLHSRTELDVVQLDEQGLVLALRSGSLALRVHSPAAAQRIEIVTPEARLQPLGPGHFRIDRGDAASGEQNHRTRATAWHGRLRVLGEEGFDVPAGEEVALWLEGSALRHVWGSPAEDVFAERVLREDAQAGRLLATTAPVPAELTGATDLARHGRWGQHPQYGPVWWPSTLHAGWVPYQHGRWVWVQPWGWTWVDHAPWAFATYYQGSWLHWQGRWVWAPRAPHDRQHWRERRHPPPGQAVRPHPPAQPLPPAYHQRPPERRSDERRDWRMRMPQPVQPVQAGPSGQTLPQQGRPGPERAPAPRQTERPEPRVETRPAPAPVNSAANPADPEREHLR